MRHPVHLPSLGILVGDLNENVRSSGRRVVRSSLKPNVQREYPKDSLLVDDRTTGLAPQRVLRHGHPAFHCGALRAPMRQCRTWPPGWRRRVPALGHPHVPGKQRWQYVRDLLLSLPTLFHPAELSEEDGMLEPSSSLDRVPFLVRRSGQEERIHPRASPRRSFPSLSVDRRQRRASPAAESNYRHQVVDKDSPAIRQQILKQRGIVVHSSSISWLKKGINPRGLSAWKTQLERTCCVASAHHVHFQTHHLGETTVEAKT